MIHERFKLPKKNGLENEIPNLKTIKFKFFSNV